MSMRDLIVGDLKIRAEDGSHGIVLSWRGKSIERQPAKVLGPYLVLAVREAASSGSLLELRFERLEHFNSSTVAVLIQLIQDCKQSGVRLSFVYDASQNWQKLSFEALQVFVRDGLLELRSS